MSYRPHMLPKVRSKALLGAVSGMPCTVRISSIIPGHRCSPQNTVIPAHMGRLGKGVSTKVSDLNVVAACFACHDLMDQRDNRWDWLMDHHCRETMKRLIDAQHETLALLLQAGIITIKGGTIE